MIEIEDFQFSYGTDDFALQILKRRVADILRIRLVVAAVALLSTGCSLGWAQDDAKRWHWDGVDRVVAIADIHGAYDAMTDTLMRAGVVNESLQWAGGATHLVVVGDLLDRGPRSRDAMDLVMRLEGEAAEAGGRVHMLLGNHEVMNLVGDLRYVAVEEYAAFADDEDQATRQRHYDAWIADESADSEDSAEFDKRFPPGFFAHRRAFRSDGLYGRWLLEKPALVTVNDTVFVHGGLAERAVGMGSERLNSELQRELRDYVGNLEVLIDSGVLSVADDYYDHLDLLEAKLPNIADNEVRRAAKRMVELNGNLLYGPNSPLWYRGTVGCSDVIAAGRLQRALPAVNAQRLVIGHTPTRNARVLSRLNDQVVRIDTGALNSYYGGRGSALIIGADGLSVVYQDEASHVDPLNQPRRVGARPNGWSVDQLEEVLASGEILSSQPDANGSRRVTLGSGGHQFEARFYKAGRGGALPEVAAYRLDRVLGLDMVPVTVIRTVDGQRGALQLLPGRTVSELHRMAARGGGRAWCPLTDQFNAMYVFDALIHNRARTPESMLYDQGPWQLMLTGHAKSFGNQRGRPDYQQQIALQLDSIWQERLAALDEGILAEAIGDVVDQRAVQALLKRRDKLLKELGGN